MFETSPASDKDLITCRESIAYGSDDATPTGGMLQRQPDLSVTGVAQSVCASDGHSRPPSVRLFGRQRPMQPLNQDLIRKTIATIDDLDPSDHISASLSLASLRDFIAQLWESALEATEDHRDILSLIDSGVAQAVTSSSVTQEQLVAIKEAACDLCQPVLSSAHVAVIRRRFLDVGVAPLGFIPEGE